MVLWVPPEGPDPKLVQCLVRVAISLLSISLSVPPRLYDCSRYVFSQIPEQTVAKFDLCHLDSAGADSHNNRFVVFVNTGHPESGTSESGMGESGISEALNESLTRIPPPIKIVDVMKLYVWIMQLRDPGSCVCSRRIGVFTFIHSLSLSSLLIVHPPSSS